MLPNDGQTESSSKNGRTPGHRKPPKRLDAELSSRSRPTGTACRKLPRDASPRLSFDPTQALMRRVLLTTYHSLEPISQMSGIRSVPLFCIISGLLVIRPESMPSAEITSYKPPFGDSSSSANLGACCPPGRALCYFGGNPADQRRLATRLRYRAISSAADKLGWLAATAVAFVMSAGRTSAAAAESTRL